MKVEILKSDNGKVIGWKLIADSETERRKLEAIRDLQFFGYDDTAIQYEGRKGGDHPEKDPLIHLKWVQKKYHAGEIRRKKQLEQRKNRP